MQPAWGQIQFEIKMSMISDTSKSAAIWSWSFRVKSIVCNRRFGDVFEIDEQKMPCKSACNA
jgi:hypothetical protein